MRWLLPSLCLLLACDPAPPVSDGGSCELDVTIGTDEESGFSALEDGDPVELLLGFQGFRMLRLALEVGGTPAEVAEISAYVSVADTGLELGQLTRERAVPNERGFSVGEWLVFFNDEPPATVVGHDAEIEVIVRAAGCTGTARVRVRVRDDDACVDSDILVDAGARDAGLADASTCEAR